MRANVDEHKSLENCKEENMAIQTAIRSDPLSKPNGFNQAADLDNMSVDLNLQLSDNEEDFGSPLAVTSEQEVKKTSDELTKEAMEKADNDKLEDRLLNGVCDKSDSPQHFDENMESLLLEEDDAQGTDKSASETSTDKPAEEKADTENIENKVVHSIDDANNSNSTEEKETLIQNTDVELNAENISSDIEEIVEMNKDDNNEVENNTTEEKVKNEDLDDSGKTQILQDDDSDKTQIIQDDDSDKTQIIQDDDSDKTQIIQDDDSDKTQIIQDEDSKGSTSASGSKKEEQDEDLLLVMDVRSSDEPEVEMNKMDSNENSCSSMMDKEEKEERMEVGQPEKTDEESCEMDIEELNVGKMLEENHSFLDKTLQDTDKTSQDSCKANNEDSDKENVQDVTLIDSNEAQKNELNKKRSIDTADEGSSTVSKKAKLEEQTDMYKSLKLTSLHDYLVSKKLQRLTRTQLEQLCLLKIAEAIASNSEIAELRHQLQVQEKVVETCRKETSQIAKQCRDLQTVQNKLMQDLKTRRNSDKPILPLKVTRSVGLQAYVVDDKRRLSVSQNSRVITPTNSTPVSPQVVTTPPAKSVPALRPTNSTTITRTLARQSTETPPRPAQVVQRTSVPPLAKPTAIVPKPAEKVIDLTDEDDRAQTSSAVQRTANSNQVINRNVLKSIPSQAGQRVMLLPVMHSKNVVLKVNSTGQPSVSNQPSPSQQVRTFSRNNVISKVKTNIVPATSKFKHPAPLPAPTMDVSVKNGCKPVPPRPHLSINKTSDGNGILLQWKMPYNLSRYENIASYQLYAYQETNQPPQTENWGKIGDVKALALPMAVTLTQFATGNRYYFAVRAVDIQERVGVFSEPQAILL